VRLASPPVVTVAEPAAIEALATSLSLVLVLFAGTYVAMATHSAGNFGEHLTHTDALYFAVTVFSTVGFGDITAKTEAARLVVTGQMITDLVVVGVGIRIILGAVTRGSSGDASSAKTPAAYRPAKPKLRLIR
jgi:hypothetical protein